jgi:hypothetical protein
VSSSGSITANYKTQYYLSVFSPSNYGSPNPTSGWFDAGSSITASVTSPWSGPTDTRYVCTGWTGTGSVPPSGTGSSVTFTITQSSSITWNWVTQYYLTVRTDPSGIVTIPGEGWYNASKSVSLSAPSVTGYTFLNWDVDGVSQGSGVSTVNVNMNAPHTATAYYTQIGPLSVSINPTTAKIKIGESVTFTSSVSGGKPPYTSYQWYLNGSAVSGATSPTWTFTPVTVGCYIVYLNVTDSAPKTAKSNEASVTVAPPLTVSISPMSASILVGQSVTFTSTVSGGYAPYSYQWYLDGAPVSGATTSTWAFAPTTSGIYYVYLKVTDDNNNVAQSETARITVATVPVGGYSYPINKYTLLTPIATHIALIAILTAIFITIKRKTTKKTKKPP